MENGMQGTSERFEQLTFLGLSAGVSDSPVRTSALPENSWDFGGNEAVCFSQLCELYKTQKKKIGPHTYLLRTLKTYLVLMEERAEMVNSDSQLYKQAGNGVTVNVIEAIAKKMEMEQNG